MSGHINIRNASATLLLATISLFMEGCGITLSSGSMAITPITPSFTPKFTTQLHAVMTTASGKTQDVTSQATWSSSNLPVATVSATGLLTTVSSGHASITASVTNAEAAAVVTVATPVVSAIAINPLTETLVAGSTKQYSVAATYSDNSSNTVSSSVQWTVNDSSIATISASGLLTAVSPGPFTVTATSGALSASASGTVAAASTPGTGTSASASSPYPIPVYTGADLSSFPTFNVANFAASGSAASTTCTGKSGSTQLTCTGSEDFKPGQGIRVVGGGKASAAAAITVQPIIVPQGHHIAGSHTYCYVVDTVDPSGGISKPSPQTCVANEPELGLATAYNFLNTTTSNVGPSPSFIWYASEDGGPFSLVVVAQFSSNASDMGQRLGNRGGWPNSLPASDPNIAKQDDLFSTVQAVRGNQITLADPLISSLTSGTVDHDDTQAVENAILASVQAGGGTIVFGQGTFNLRRPAFSYVQNGSYAYPPYTTQVSKDPWWARFSYLYVPNGSAGNINFQGAGRKTILVTAPDHGGTAHMLSVGNEQREGAVGTPILKIEEVAKGSTQVTLTSAAAASTLSPGDDIFLYSGTYNQKPDVDTTSVPDVNHFTELNTVASISGKVINLVYPTSKRYFDDGGSSFGLTKLPVTPHNIEIQHMNIDTSEPVISSGDVIGLLVNDVQVPGTLSQGAFGGGYKRGVTVEHSQWSFGQGTAGWGQEDEYDDFTDLAFIDNKITGYAAAGSEGPSEMARIYATEGTSEVLFTGNTFDHVSLYADQTTEYYVQNNTFTDGIVTAGMAYGPYTPRYDPSITADPSFLSFDSQESFSTDHNTFTITSDFNPPWVIRAGDFSSGNISNNTITYSGARAPGFLIGSFNGTVLNNTITIQSPAVGNVIALVPDQSPDTPVSTFTAQGNVTTANVIAANIVIPNPGFTDTQPVCVENNTLQVSQGNALNEASSIVNKQCP